METHSRRLLIRSLQPADARPLAEMWADPEVTRFMGGPRDWDEVERILAEDGALAIVLARRVKDVDHDRGLERVGAVRDVAGRVIAVARPDDGRLPIDDHL
jgi:hypothetical protein